MQGDFSKSSWVKFLLDKTFNIYRMRSLFVRGMLLFPEYILFLHRKIKTLVFTYVFLLNLRIQWRWRIFFIGKNISLIEMSINNNR
jgi:hypothetical protein